MAYELLQELERRWKRKGNKLVKAFRCPFGFRKGRTVSNMKTCIAKKKPAKMRNKLRVSNIRNKAKRVQKTRIANKKAIHFRLIRLNKALRRR